MKMDGGPNHAIKWGTYREGVRSQLQKFQSLPQDGLTLIQSYQAVLDNDETFTQYFSEEPLESYTIETRLRETLGIRPPCSSDCEPSRGENNPSISWVNIFRHGNFEKQSDGSYHCYDQGNLVQIDESLHKSILLNRCFLPANSYLWPSPTDAERESEITLAIEADVLDELDKNIKYVEKLKRLQLALKKRRSKLQGIRGIRGPVKRSRTPQTPASQHPTPNESYRPTLSVETHDARARSSSESSGVSSGSDIPFAVHRDISKPISCDGGEDNAVDSSVQQEENLVTESNQQAYDNEIEVSVSGLLSDRKPDVSQSQDDTRKSQKFQENGSPKHRLHGNEDLMRPPPKKQKIETGPSPTDIETINLSEELPMWKDKVDTPIKPQPTSSTAGRRRKGQKRIRNNFTDYEKEHAPAWLKSQMDAGKLPVDIEKAYVERFGVFHRWLTMKLWIDRMEEKAAKAKRPSKIVVLKPIRASPTNSKMPAAVPKPGYAAAPPYVSPYPLFRSSQQPQGSPVMYELDWPSKTAASPPIKSGLPNV